VFEADGQGSLVIVHVSTFRLRPGTTPGQIAEIVNAFAEMQARIPTIRSVQCGADLGITPNSGDFAAVLTFEDRDGVETYRSHAAHVELARQHIVPYMESYTPVQFEPA
jgi:hypothetical protein